MPDIDIYDYQHPPGMPDGVHTTQYFFPQEKKREFLYSSAPWTDAPCMALHYDKDGNLLLTRFIFRDGVYRDAT
jgi:hypothetical protein